MGRIVLLIIIGFVAYLVFRGLFRGQGDSNAPSMKPGEGAKAEDMVACARCGVHLPRSDAVLEGGTFHCRDNPRCGAP